MNNEEFAQKNTCRLKKVLVTGASGFIGSFLVEGGLERDMQVWLVYVKAVVVPI